MTLNDQRLTLANLWLREQLSTESQLSMVAGDASFRRYFRVLTSQQSYILMDAPPDKESCTEFLDVTERLHNAGLHAPKIYAQDIQQGFLLLEDLGDGLFRDALDIASPVAQYQTVFDTLKHFAYDVNTTGLPDYDQSRLQCELDLFPEWYAPHHCKQPLTDPEQSDWKNICQQLNQCALNQPQVFVHRDFHSCNVLETDVNTPGLIDYQDAVNGPISYDLVSWLLDRYISWPRSQIVDWYEQHRQRLSLDISATEWLRWCDWMGLQRNLKVLGIFARLYYRDKKNGYIELMPRFYNYVFDSACLYSETQALIPMLEKRPCEQ